MKKLLPILVVCFLVLSGLGAVAVDNENSEMIEMSFSSPTIEEFDNEYIDVNLQESSTLILDPGKPVLPYVVKAIELPFGVKNVKVKVTPKNVQEYEVTQEIRPAQRPVPKLDGIDNLVVEFVKDENVYASTEPYPSSWYKFKVGCGLNDDNELVTHVSTHIFPIRYVPASDKLLVTESVDIEITYEDPMNPTLFPDVYDQVIIAPPKFTSNLQEFVDHKNNYCGIKTILVTTTEIYDGDYFPVPPEARDKPEEIKYFIKSAIEEWGITYVLFVGGLNSLIWAKPRDDDNQGTEDWYVPVRYANLYDDPLHPLGEILDPGVISDLYYMDIYKEGGVFEDWDPNGDDIFAAWRHPDFENDTGLDLFPDVSVGRLACRNNREVKIMVNKIINYEKNAYGKDWFKKMTVISGDGFLDQVDLDFQWDVNELDNGEYTIYAQSINQFDEEGEIDQVTVTLNKDVESNITFLHDDHLQIDDFPNYPWTPIAEITSPTTGDILGNTDVWEEPHEGKAYGNEFTQWANVEYENGIMHIRGKSYDPQPYGNVTDIHVWIENDIGEEVFSDWRINTKMYYEGEWTTGEKLLKGRGGALYYMPEDFTINILWASNGGIVGMDDVKTEFTKGAGFVFFSGHGSPHTWGDHFPGVPGNRARGSYTGLRTYDLGGLPYFHMDVSLRNFNKPSIVVVGGCHNSQFNVSLITGWLDKNNSKHMWCYGIGAPECWSWWLTRLNNRGAIATIGNTGLGYGTLGDDCNIGGLDAWISVEVHRQYGEEGHDILGDAYVQTLLDYTSIFDMTILEEGHAKTVQQWVLLGDPTLKIGGYSEDELQSVTIDILENNGDSGGSTHIGDGNPGSPVKLQASAYDEATYYWDLDNDGEFDDAVGEIIEEIWDSPGLYDIGVKAVYANNEEKISHTLVEILYDEFPTKPSRPSGPSSVRVGKTNTYKTSSTDPNGYLMYYLFDWDDGTYSLEGPEPSGEEVSATHKFTEQGSYEVKVWAINEYAYWSEWSDPLTISTPRNRITENTLLLRLLEQFPNAFPLLRYILGL